MILIRYLPCLAVCISLFVTGCGATTTPAPSEPAPPASQSREAQTPETPKIEPLASTGASPNVIWILLDACRAQNLSCYGYERETSPNMDALAREGVLFERNYAQASTTTLSLPSYMSGKLFPVACIAGNWGQVNWRQLYRTPPPDEKLITEIMRDNGYHAEIITAHPWFGPETRLVESADHCSFVPAKGVQHGYANFEMLNEVAFQFLEKPHEKPFFLYLHTMDTHFPHYVRPGHDQWIDRAHAGNPPPDKPMLADKKPESGADKELLRGLYDGGIHFADAAIKNLLDKLDALGMRDNTILIISSDHGECLGEDGETLEHPPQFNYEELVHTPLIMAGPGLPKGKRVASLSQNLDIVPTIIGLLRLTTEARFDGKDLTPLLREDGPDAIHQYAVGRWPRGEEDYVHFVSLRDGTYRYEYYPHYEYGRLWQHPDHVYKRTELTGKHPEVESTMRDHILDTLLPKWDAYLALPRSSPRVFSLPIAPRQSITPEAFLPDSTETDNKWQLQPNILRSFATKEDAPPISFKFEVPNGTYVVLMELKPLDYGAAFRITAESDAAPRLIQSSNASKAREFVQVNVYDIYDESFDVTLDDAGPPFNAEMISFLFVPVIDGEPMKYADNLEERQSQLDALGYGGHTENTMPAGPQDE